jgi:hypothetical protein
MQQENFPFLASMWMCKARNESIEIMFCCYVRRECLQVFDLVMLVWKNQKVDCVMCFQESELYVSISGEHGRLSSLKAVSVLCFQDPLFFGYTRLFHMNLWKTNFARQLLPNHGPWNLWWLGWFQGDGHKWGNYGFLITKNIAHIFFD